MTDRTTHTPGPWSFEYTNDTGPEDGYFWEWWDVLASDGNNVAEVCSNADARLIASAPDLLAALVDAVRSLDYAAPIIEAPDNSFYRETIAAARAAIAKARGE